MDELTDTQRAAVSQLRDITNGGDDEVAISVLNSVDWDVERAADMIFGGGGNTHSNSNQGPPAQPPQPPVSAAYEPFEVDDSDQLLPTRPSSSSSHRNHHHRHRQARPAYDIIPRPILTLITFPLQLLSSILKFVFSILRIPFPPRIFPFTYLTPGYRPLPRQSSSGNSSRRRAHGTSTKGQESWIRDLEEETGAVSISRARARAQERQQQAGSSTGAETNASSNNLVSRGAAASGVGDSRILPDFASGTYEETLRRIQKELQVGCIILVSDEHDDVPEFKRTTLTDPALVNFLYENNIIVWGGDVGDADAHGASLKLQATTYPFVAFVALQPPRSTPGSRSSSSSSSTASTLTVLSRHQGKSAPASSGPTSAQVLLDHLQTQVIPRVTPFLGRLRAVQDGHERDRRIREEQDRAYKETMRRDKERIEASMRQARERKEREKKEEERKRDEERRRQEERERERRKEALKNDWKTWIKYNVVGEEPASNHNGILRFAIRFPNGSRVLRKFEETDTLTKLYAFVGSQLLNGDGGRLAKGSAPPEGMNMGSAELTLEARLALEADAEGWWGFVVASTYPRHTIKWQSGLLLGEVEGVKAGGQLVVELVGNGGRSSGRSSMEGRNGNGTPSTSGASSRSEEEEDDAYKTESDEE